MNCVVRLTKRISFLHRCCATCAWTLSTREKVVLRGEHRINAPSGLGWTRVSRILPGTHGEKSLWHRTNSKPLVPRSCGHSDAVSYRAVAPRLYHRVVPLRLQATYLCLSTKCWDHHSNSVMRQTLTKWSRHLFRHQHCLIPMSGSIFSKLGLTSQHHQSRSSNYHEKIFCNIESTAREPREIPRRDDSTDQLRLKAVSGVMYHAEKTVCASWNGFSRVVWQRDHLRKRLFYRRTSF